MRTGDQTGRRSQGNPRGQAGPDPGARGRISGHAPPFGVRVSHQEIRGVVGRQSDRQFHLQRFGGRPAEDPGDTAAQQRADDRGHSLRRPALGHQVFLRGVCRRGDTSQPGAGDRRGPDTDGRKRRAGLRSSGFAGRRQRSVPEKVRIVPGVISEAGSIAVVTGGDGALAASVAAEMERAGYAVFAPGRDGLDVTRAESVSAFFHGLERIDLLINAAGMTADAPVARMTEVDWDRVVETNLTGAFRCAREALAKMAPRRSGHIVNIGSFSALNPPPGQAAYAAAKAGLIGLTQSLAAEYGGRNVRVNCVLPGFLETPMTAKLSSSVVEAARARHVLGRFNTPEDTARFILHLDSLSAVSGQVFQLDSRLRRWT
ncbi:MAG: SDR family oxidoreductase [Akkermansiaceae bacterium]|nr:SDR family oxidoreductase [Akkermansiaceae bacterium]